MKKDILNGNSLFESIKEQAETIKTMVFIKTLTAGFTDQEKKILNTSLNVIDSAKNKVQKSLNYYDVVVKSYRSIR